MRPYTDRRYGDKIFTLSQSVTDVVRLTSGLILNILWFSERSLIYAGYGGLRDKLNADIKKVLM